jgi:hypothetical protein
MQYSLSLSLLIRISAAQTTGEKKGAVEKKRTRKAKVQRPICHFNSLSPLAQLSSQNVGFLAQSAPIFCSFVLDRYQQEQAMLPKGE